MEYEVEQLIEGQSYTLAYGNAIWPFVYKERIPGDDERLYCYALTDMHKQDYRDKNHYKYGEGYPKLCFSHRIIRDCTPGEYSKLHTDIKSHYCILPELHYEIY